MEMRKVSIWHSDRNNFISTGVNYLDNEYYGIEKAGDNFVYAYQQGLLGIPVFSKKNNSFLIHAHAHFDEVENPAMVGYMTESLFQQLGIAYFVYSGTLNKSYWYNPEVRHIVMLDQPVAVGKFDISVGSKSVLKEISLSYKDETARGLNLNIRQSKKVYFGSIKEVRRGRRFSHSFCQKLHCPT